jgi:M6 family metalloprotease-like protein
MSRNIIPLALPLALLATAVSLDAAGGQARRFAEVEPVAARAAAPLQGRLEMVWGDAAPGSSAKNHFEVTLVDDAGRRIALDPDAAFKAAGDLHALYGRRVAITLTPQLRTKSTSALAQAEVIVPIDDLDSGAKVAASDVTTKAISGTRVWATLMCKFKDRTTEQKNKQYFTDQYANIAGRLDHYWRKVSYNNINLAGSTAYGWFTLPQTYAYYTSSSLKLNELFNDCTGAANSSVNFAANGGLAGINLVFNEALPNGASYGGCSSRALDGVDKCWPNTWMSKGQSTSVAGVAHEMGHAMGLKHANNSDRDSDTTDNPWDLMSEAWEYAAYDATYGTLPKHINTYGREQLGWIPSGRLRTVRHGDAANTFTLDRASLASSQYAQMIKLIVPGSTTRYYTIETRMKTGTYEAQLPDNAVIIHSVDTARTEPSWSVDASSPPANFSDNEGSMFKVGESWVSPEPSGQRFKVEVKATTTNGFSVRVSSQ